MANIHQAEATSLLAALNNGTAYTVPAAWYLAVDTSTTAPTATGYGSEVSGGSYARQTIGFAAAASGASNSNTAQTFTNMPAATCASIEIFTTVTATTRRLWYGALTANKTTASGDTLSFASGAVTTTLG